MSKRLLFFFLIVFFGLNGCLYSCNYAPKNITYTSTDPCINSQDTKLIKFVDITGSNGSANISMVMSLPCKGSGSVTDTYSLAFYDKNNLQQPVDLTNAIYSSWTMKAASCSAITSDENKEVIDIAKKDINLYKLSAGAAITMGVGAKHSNRLYPYYIKIPIDNPNAVGQPYGGDADPGSCVNGVNMAPFIQNPNNLSPVYQNNSSITTESGEVSFAMYNYQLVQIAAPLWTYGTKIESQGSEQGLKSSPGQSPEGSYFYFEVKLKPGEYYVVLSKVPKPMQAMIGDFSLKDVKIYNANTTNKYSNYLEDCGRDISCGGRATAVTVS